MIIFNLSIRAYTINHARAPAHLSFFTTAWSWPGQWAFLRESLLTGMRLRAFSMVILPIVFPGIASGYPFNRYASECRSRVTEADWRRIVWHHNPVRPYRTARLSWRREYQTWLCHYRFRWGDSVTSPVAAAAELFDFYRYSIMFMTVVLIQISDDIFIPTLADCWQRITTLILMCLWGAEIFLFVTKKCKLMLVNYHWA